MRRFCVAAWLLGAFGACKKSPPPPIPEAIVQTPPSPTPASARCAPLSAEPPFVLGPTDTGRVGADASDLDRDDSLPFAALVGEGVAYAGGFALGAIHE